ncbi:MAG: GNAT family N-acetyltransferase [Acidimicrobiia bacterium]
MDDVELVPVAHDDKPVLGRLVQLYRYDFASIRGYELDESGMIPYRYLDRYFDEPHREACFIRHRGNLAGFTMTSALDAEVRAVSEFFVVRHHRRRGVGRRAAGAMFRRHPGRWMLQFDTANSEAVAFWPGVAAALAAGVVESRPKAAASAFPGTELRFEVIPPVVRS